jgi:hypothetical protein
MADPPQRRLGGLIFTHNLGFVRFTNLETHRKARWYGHFRLPSKIGGIVPLAPDLPPWM